MIPTNTYRYLPIPDNTWQYLAIPGNTWQYLTIAVNTWQYLAITGNNWQYLVIPGNTWWYLAIPDNYLQYLLLPYNTFQFQTIPNKLGINWYCLVFTIHQVSLPIWYQYRHSISMIRYWWFCVHLVSSQYWFWHFSVNLQCLARKYSSEALCDSTHGAGCLALSSNIKLGWKWRTH